MTDRFVVVQLALGRLQWLVAIRIHTSAGARWRRARLLRLTAEPPNARLVAIQRAFGAAEVPYSNPKSFVNARQRWRGFGGAAPEKKSFPTSQIR
jgi:hypothetical protein